MRKAEFYAKYKHHREKYNCNADNACRWAKHKPGPQYITSLPYSDKPIRIVVPGLGHVCFQIADDPDHDPYDGDGQAFQWWSTDGDSGNRKYNVGTRIDDNAYSLDHWDGGSVYVIRFDKKAGSRFEDRFEYHHARGMSKQDAYIKACASIKSECEYWHKVAKGDICFVGGMVTLYASDEEDGNLDELDQEAVWGYEYPSDDDYLLGEMNSWAMSLIAKHWQKQYECEAPGTRGDKIVDAAWQAWHTAMATSDNDREIADPIFVSTYKEGLYGKRFRAGRVLQNRRGRALLRSGSEAAS